MRVRGLEPPRPFGLQSLELQRLPVSSYPQIWCSERDSNPHNLPSEDSAFACYATRANLVPEAGFQPARPLGQRLLKPPCLACSTTRANLVDGTGIEPVMPRRGARVTASCHAVVTSRPNLVGAVGVEPTLFPGLSRMHTPILLRAQKQKRRQRSLSSAASNLSLAGVLLHFTADRRPSQAKQ